MMKFKWVGTLDHCKVIRLCRFTWSRGIVGDGIGYSAQLSVALSPQVCVVRREWQSLCVTFLGLRLHLHRSYGGIFDP